MAKAAIVIALTGLILSAPLAAQAGADKSGQTAALSECLQMKSTGADRLTFAGWMVSAMASAPQLKDVAVVNPAKRDQLNRELAKVFTRLIVVDCAETAKPLLKAGDKQAFGGAFEVLGRMAMQELTGNPESSKAMGEFANYLDEADFKALAK